MTRYRCESCCCGPAIRLNPPKGAVPICSTCGTALTPQPLVRPIPLLILLAVGSVLVLSSVPVIFNPSPPSEPKRDPALSAWIGIRMTVSVSEIDGSRG